MSGQIGGNIRTLPFTGLAALPLIVIALAVIGMGLLLMKVVPKKNYEVG